MMFSAFYMSAHVRSRRFEDDNVSFRYSISGIRLREWRRFALGSDLDLCQRLIFTSHFRATAAIIQPLDERCLNSAQKLYKSSMEPTCCLSLSALGNSRLDSSSFTDKKRSPFRT